MEETGDILKEKEDYIIDSFKSLNLSNLKMVIPRTERGQTDWVCLRGKVSECSLCDWGTTEYSKWNNS